VNQSTDKNRIICASCLSYETETLFSANDKNFHTTEEIFSIVQCTTCGITFTHPQPSPDIVSKYYPKLYYPVGKNAEKYIKNHIEPFQHDKIVKVLRYKKSGRILDVGCGPGYFVREAKHAGFDAEGIEFSQLAVEYGLKLWDVNIKVDSFLESDFKTLTYDIITLWQVLEHLYHPTRIIEKAKKLLNSGGLLVIAIPNFASFQATFFKQDWYHLEVPRHLFHYTPKSITNLLEKQGFKILDIDFWCREHNGAGFLGSVLQFNNPNETYFQKVLRKTMGKYATDALAVLESALGKGGTMTVFAEKK